MLLSLTGASASTLTVKIIHPRTDPYETPSNRFVTFAAAAFDSVEQDVSAKSVFTWDFGDGAKAEENPISHLYKPGEYKITVTATFEDARGEASMTVIVGEPAPLPEVGLRQGGPLILRLPEEMPAGKACDQPVIACVEALPVGDATYCNFYYRSPGEVYFQGHSGGPAWNLTWGAYKLFGMADWHSCVEQNYQAGTCGWKAELYPSWWEDPVWVGPEGWGLDNTIVKAEDDCGAPYSGVLAYDPQGAAPTISWTLSHLAFHTVNDDDPPFNVRLKIYKLDGTLVFTYDMADELLSDYVDELTWEGWQGAYDDWENPLPGTAGAAPKGLYAYRVWAVHDLDGIWPTGFDFIEVAPAHDCKYSDKSYKVLGTVNAFYYFDKDVQAGTLKGVVKYTLNRLAADTVTIRFFDPDLDEFPGSALTAQDCSAGTHWSDVFTLTGVDFDQNDDPVGPISCVLYVEETAADGAANRDCEAMSALHRGTTALSELLDLSGGTLIDPPLTEHDEEDPGAFVHYNIDNDDASDNTLGGTKHPGSDLLQQEAPVTGEDDLLPAIATFDTSIQWGKVGLVRTGAAILIWTDAAKGEDDALLVEDASHVWDLSVPAEYAAFHAAKSSLFVEGADYNGEADLKLQFLTPDDTLICEDVVHYTAIAANCENQPPTEGGVRAAWEQAFPNLRRCEWSMTGAPRTYNCIAWSVDEDSVWYDAWAIDQYFGDNDGIFEVTDMDAFYSSKKSWTPIATGTDEERAEAAEAMYYPYAGDWDYVNDPPPSTGYHAARRSRCTCGDGQWIMYTSKCGAEDRIEHIWNQLNGSVYGSPGRFYH